MPLMVYRLMELYPQANAMRPSVFYVPTPLTPQAPQRQAPATPPAVK
jgi:hypothetical protein